MCTGTCLQLEFAWIVTVATTLLLLGALFSGLVLDRWGAPRTMRACFVLLAVGQAILAVVPHDNAVWLWLGVICLSLPAFGVCCSALCARFVSSAVSQPVCCRVHVACIEFVPRVYRPHSLAPRPMCVCTLQFPSSAIVVPSVNGPVFRRA